MLTRRFLPIAVATLLGALAGCGDGVSFQPTDENPSGLPTIGELWDMAQASTAPDSDGDFIPDDVERNTIGTNPNDRDTDHDGLPDNYEIFGLGVFDPDAYVPDLDKDALIAALDKDDDDDLVNDGFYIDTDGDGLANYLEFYGYVYDWMTGMFMCCEDVNCTGQAVYRSDPLQFSTDQDPYPDGMEVSGENMDVSVTGPGDHPLVPAYPNLVAELAGYTVTLNEDITYGRSGSIARGTEWSRETTAEHSQTAEVEWEGGLEVGSENKVSTGIHLKASATNTTSHSSSTGTSIISEFSWEESRSFNPTDAARLKLFLKLRNYGTACATNIVPTLTLKIAGLNVATFQPGGAPVNMLVPGGVYPEEEGVYWTVGTTETGEPISLTMTELRALERGAPVSIVMTQVGGDVMLRDEAGAWESVGDSNEFMARCDAACATLRLDMGAGSFLHTLVYGSDGPSGPVVTLEDALRWTADATDVQGDLEIVYMDREGMPQSTVLREWSFAFDRDTLKANGFDPDDLADTMPADFDVGAMVLLPESIVIGKAPRALAQPKPTIQFAILDQDQRLAMVGATDYRGVAQVVVHATVDPGDGSGPTQHEWPMMEEGLGANVYFYDFNDDEWAIIDGILQRWFDSDPDANDVLKVTVTSVDGEDNERPFGQIPPNPRPVEHIIDFVRLDLASDVLYAQVIPDDRYPPLWSDTYPVQWVRAYHGAFPGGYIPLQAPPNAYEDPYGWQCDLPSNWSDPRVKVVAYVAPGVYTERWVDVLDVTSAYAQGPVDLEAGRANDAGTAVFLYEGLDLDSRTNIVVSRDDPPLRGDWKSEWNEPASVMDFYVRWDATQGTSDWKFYFNVPFAAVTGVAFEDIGPSEADALIPYADFPSTPPPDHVMGTPQTFEANTSIFVYRTSEGRVGKCKVTYKKTWQDKILGFIPIPSWWCRLSLHYVVFAEPAAVASAPASVVVDANDPSVTLDGRGSTGADSWLWTIVSQPGNATLVDETKSVAELVPDAAGDYRVKLTINDEASTEIDIHVDFPVARIAFSPANPTFGPTDVPLVSLQGGDSLGAKTYYWRLAGRPTGSLAEVDAGTQRSKNTSFTPDEEGSYVVELTINNGDGANEDTVTQTITVVFAP